MKIVYNSFEGRYADSPRVLFEALRDAGSDATHVWLADPQYAAGFPADCPTVGYGTPAAVEALESADVVIANTYTDLAWAKRPDTLYVQTWHGTPLKRIHWDVLWTPPGLLERLSLDVARWDCLVSPSHESTPWLRGAFRYHGEVLEAGYPRNDVLDSPDRDAIRARVREQLGIDDDRTAVLYAPTWRDDEVLEGGGRDFRFPLDLDAFAEQLGDDHVLLLRLHYKLTGRLGPIAHPSIRDVSSHADISSLYLASDVMVTDYSSTMFDFAVTGRPILFYTYDLSHYQGRLRGFYFDFVAEAPGPLLETSQEVIDALGGLAAVVERHAARYARFRDRFCHLEDGRATDRVLNRIFAGART